MLNDILESKKNKFGTRVNTVERKKPTTPEHKTKLKLKGNNPKDNYTTNIPNANRTKFGMSMDIIHDPKKGRKLIERKEINLKTVTQEENEEKERKTKKRRSFERRKKKRRRKKKKRLKKRKLRRKKKRKKERKR